MSLDGCYLFCHKCAESSRDFMALSPGYKENEIDKKNND